MEYVQVSIPCLDEKKELIIAELEAMGYEGFWEEGQLINAFAERSVFSEKDLYRTLSRYHMENSYHISNLEDKNWNEEWESNFEPVEIDRDVRIRATFHSANPSFKHEIIINPEMSFGTGHHETTDLMLRLMLDLDFQNQTVLDLGCGTGVLAIFAQKLGATNVTAIDNDQRSFENCKDNIKLNNASEIKVLEGSIDQASDDGYDLILSNITRNINQTLIPGCYDRLNPGGYLLISGFLDFDRNEMQIFCEKLGFNHVTTLEKNKWQGMVLQK